MIIVGYQVIGKSSISNPNTRCIDLESGNFFADGKRPDDWYKYYVNIAKHLSAQGYTVFVSSHKAVRDELKATSAEDVAVCFPAIDIKEQWIERLRDRYKRTGLDKDLRALLNAEQNYAPSIAELCTEATENGWKMLVIETTNYDLYFDFIIPALKRKGGEKMKRFDTLTEEAKAAFSETLEVAKVHGKSDFRCGLLVDCALCPFDTDLDFCSQYRTLEEWQDWAIEEVGEKQ